MDVVTGWTGRAACALQAALRMSNEAFAEHLGIAVRTVAAWHQKPGLRPRPEMQQVLDAALARVPAAAGERFAVLTGEPAPAVSARADDDGAAAEAEHRLITDQNISRALSRLDQLAAWEPGTARRTVAARLAGLDTRDLLDRASRRSRIGRDDVADALGKYYRCQAAGHGRYGARCGHDGREIVTSVLTCPDWLDLDCPLTAGHDRLTHAGPAARADVPLDAGAAGAAAQRLAETLVAGTRFVDMPLYRLTGIRVGKGEIGGSLGITPFASYALTLDLLEGELADALAAGIPPEPGSLPLRDRYLPDLASVLGVAGRLCAGGALALCAFARPADPYRGPADYALLVQERSSSVVNPPHSVIHSTPGPPRAGDETPRTSNVHTRPPLPPFPLLSPGLNLVSGNFEFACLIVIDSDEFWSRFGGQIEASWESSSLRQYSSLDGGSLAALADDSGWSNEGLFAFLQGLRRLRQVGTAVPRSFRG